MGKSTRGARWAAGFSLLRENSQSSVNIPLLTREIIQPLHTHECTHLGRWDGVVLNTILIGVHGGRAAHFCYIIEQNSVRF